MLKASFKQAMAKQAQQKSGGATATTAQTAAAAPSSNANGQATSAQSASASPDPRKSLVPTFAAKGAERWGMGQRAMSDEEFALLQALNKVRTDPASLIPHLKERLSHLSSDGTSIAMPGKDVETAVEVLPRTTSLLKCLKPCARW